MRRIAFIIIFLTIVGLTAWRAFRDPLSAEEHFRQGMAFLEEGADEAWVHLHAVAYDAAASPRHRHQALHGLVVHGSDRNFHFGALRALRQLEAEAPDDIDYRYYLTLAVLEWPHPDLALAVVDRGRDRFPEHVALFDQIHEDVETHRRRAEELHDMRTSHRCLGLGYLDCFGLDSRKPAPDWFAAHELPDFNGPLDCRH
ncbi:MAG: hypothetical protein RL885_32270 [Planctomycetota bacterium]